MHRFKASHSKIASRSVRPVTAPSQKRPVDLKRLPVLPPSPPPTDNELPKNETIYIADFRQLFPSRKKNFTGDGAMTPPSTPSSPLIEEQIEFLHNSWRAFFETENGEVDQTIETFKTEKPLPVDFVPFNIDQYLAEKLLKELDIDPKFAVF